ncbi:MAG: hypothetical protein H7321_07440 [Bacteroidia bacterium]|nr:hypothetical protein [Bacteroidia bacterium]
MSKKLFIYGLAFASAAAAFTYLYYANAVYQDLTKNGIFLLCKEFVLPSIAIVLFLISMKKDLLLKPENTDKVAVSGAASFNIGKAIFSGFMLSIIISCGTSFMYLYLLKYQPHLILLAKENTLAMLESKKSAFPNFEETRKYYQNDFFTNGNQLRVNIFTASSVGLFVSAITAYIIRPKQPK